MMWTGMAAVAAVVLAVVVPRLPAPSPEDGPLPDYRSLATPGAVAAVFAATLLAAQALRFVPVALWPAWLPYLALGAPLVYVDLRTTYLPKRLHYLAFAGVGTGLALVAATRPAAALLAVAGGAAAFGALWLAWRVSGSFGFGDVRLAALVGALAAASDAGPAAATQAWLTALLLGTLLGAIAGIVWSIIRRRTNGPAYFPYGPWLWLGPIVGAALSGW